MLVNLKRLTFTDATVSHCLLPPSLFNQLGLEEHETYTLVAGKLHTEASFSYEQNTSSAEQLAHSLQIPSLLLEHLSLYEDMQLHIWKKDDKIHLGPVVGVFLNTRYIQELEQGEETPTLIQNHMLANEHSKCVTYFFSVNDINWFDCIIHGYSYNINTKTWHKKWYPMPDVLYDRGASFEPEHKALVKHIRQQFSYDKTIKKINSLHYLGKWQLYKALSKYSFIKPYLPETIEYKELADITCMLERYSLLFIKSFYGSRGREIITIEKSDQYKVTYYDNNLGLKALHLESLQEVLTLLETLILPDKRYLIQQGINLLHYENRPTDIRVLTQKNSAGEWEAVYRHVNIAGENSYITTLDSDDMYYQDYYEHFRSHSALLPTQTQINQVAIEISQIIERELGPMAEMGLDIAIDKDYQIWFIEANSKPEKYPGPGIYNSDYPTKQFYNILEYAKYLTITKHPAKELLQSLVIKPSTLTNEADYEASHEQIPSVSVPELLYQYMSESKQKTFYLAIGQWRAPVIFTPNSTDNQIIIPYHLLAKYSDLFNIKCSFKWSNNTLTLGPVIGVFVSNGNIRRMRQQKPKFRHYELSNANNSCNTILYYFSIKDVDFVNQRILGMYYDSDDKCWKRRAFPLPEVFYDRGGGVLAKQKIKSQYIREQLNNIPNMKKINPQHYFDKWLTHKKLINQPDMIPFLPPTINYESIDSLKSMLDKHNHLYVKDSFGSNGRGILKVSRLSEHEYTYSYFSNRVYEETVGSIKALHSAIESFINSEHLVIQYAIPLIEIDNRSIDLRATMQRTGRNEVDILSLPVRMGCQYSPITSTQSGSNVFEFNSFFEDYLSYTKSEIEALRQKIESFLHTCYCSIETCYGVFGEIGIDFAVDVNGRIWFIECNAKPGYDAMYKSYDRNTIEKTFTNPLEYAKIITMYN
ncbi:YheC/YheD family protein [Desulfuribacillus alkaliarsenatis]|uniref:ATP-grasp domain-containing protein n=1 Tax=Desulfuribacillus alkaliarsenatis TaxID=766136 RepID=A0A1E5FYC0_9FIRM|nr:YheC/YheD family protein [Desulfuribacillus alkaliarsenatis]OEF95565.1 hypothetical protein BHF68_11960 [Desulfuribacillus alkaliarsenatis]